MIRSWKQTPQFMSGNSQRNPEERLQDCSGNLPLIIKHLAKIFKGIQQNVLVSRDLSQYQAAREKNYSCLIIFCLCCHPVSLHKNWTVIVAKIYHELTHLFNDGCGSWLPPGVCLGPDQLMFSFQLLLLQKLPFITKLLALARFE